jgi:hypothetical protein
MAYQLNSKPLPVDVAFKTSDGTQYPSNWLRLSTADQKKAIGITEVAEPTSYDRRFYSEVDKPRDLAELKTLWIGKQKEEAGDLLSKYDWYVVRKAEKTTAIPTAITTYRDGVRTNCKTREDEITACSDVAALKKLVDETITAWPVDPNAES